MATLLIADDSIFMRSLIKGQLKDEDIEVVAEASNGAEAFTQYKIHKPDVVTMDITMKEVHGIDGTRMICDYDPNAKVIMLSAMGQESFVKNALMAGASDFCVKPVQKERLVEAIRKALAR